jgi:hypothetical protein
MFVDRFDLALVWIWSHIPGLSHTRHLSLLAGPFVLSAALLAGRGLEALLRPQSVRARYAMAMALGVIVVLGATVWAVGVSYKPGYMLPALLGPGLLAMLLWLRGNRLATAHPGLLAAMVVLASGVAVVPQLHLYLGPIDRNPVQTRSTDTAPADSHWLYSPAKTRTWVDMNRLVARLAAADPAPGVFVFHSSITSDDQHYTTAGTVARLQGWPTFQYFHSPRVHWKFFAQNYQFPNYAFYAHLGGRYLIAEGALVDPLLEQVGQEGALFAYRIAASQPLVVPICGATGLLGDWRGRTSQLPRPPDALLAPGRAAEATPAACAGTPVINVRVDRAQDALRFDLVSAGADVLVLNLPPYAGWRLTIGGRQVPVFALDDNRIIAAVPSGLLGPAALAYRPMRYLLLLRVSEGSAVVFALIWAYMTWRRHRRAGRVPTRPAPATASERST